MADRRDAPPLGRKELTRRVVGYLDTLRRENNRVVAMLRQAGRFDYINAHAS